MSNTLPAPAQHGRAILIVCPTIPAHDRNAGDWRIFALCRALAATRTVYVLPLTFLWQGSTSLDALRSVGVRVLFPGQGGVFQFPALLKKYDIGTVMFEWFTTAEHFLRYFPLCPRTIIDTHELFYLKESRRRTVEATALSADRHAAVRQQELDVYRVADVLIAITAQERRILLRMFPDKKIIVVPTWYSTPLPRQTPPFGQRKDIVFLASFHNSEQLDAMRYFCDKVLPSIRRQVRSLTLHVAGDQAYMLQEYLRRKNMARAVRIDGVVPDLYAYLSAFRVFVCPLRYGAGLKKKILDAAVAGCPVVTTRSGMEGARLRPGRDIVVADTAAAFARATVAVYRDETLWHALSESARSAVLARHPYGQGMDQLERCITI